MGAILYAVRAFKGSVAKRIPDFKLPDSLRDPQAPDLRVVIGDGARLYFTLALQESAPMVYGGIDLREVASPEANGRRWELQYWCRGGGQRRT